MLDTELKSQLAAYLEKLQQPIELVASLDDSDTSRELDVLLGEIAALSPKMSRAVGDDARKPSFLIRRVGTSDRYAVHSVIASLLTPEQVDLYTAAYRDLASGDHDLGETAAPVDDSGPDGTVELDEQEADA